MINYCDYWLYVETLFGFRLMAECGGTHFWTQTKWWEE